MSDFLDSCIKRELCEIDLSSELFLTLGLNIEDIYPLRNAFHIYSSEGEFILKKCNMSVERIDFIKESLNYCRKGFPNLMEYKENKNGDIVTRFNEENYVLIKVIEGREVVYTDLENIFTATRTIADFHKSGVKIRKHQIEKYKRINDKAEHAVKNFENKIEVLDRFYFMANDRKYKTEFDKLFMQNKNTLDQLGNSTIKKIDYDSFSFLYGEEDKFVLCHNDLAHHNILIKDGEGYLIDFDFSVIDIRLHDLCNFSNKVLKCYGYNIDLLDNIIKEYNSINPLTITELKLLFTFLTFPGDILSLISSYYKREKSWSEVSFANKLKRKLYIFRERLEFNRELDERIDALK